MRGGEVGAEGDGDEAGFRGGAGEVGVEEEAEG